MKKDYKPINVFGLMVKCPRREPLSDCLLQKHRTKSLEDRLTVAEQFTENELDEIIAYCYDCERN